MTGGRSRQRSIFYKDWECQVIGCTQYRWFIADLGAIRYPSTRTKCCRGAAPSYIALLRTHVLLHRCIGFYSVLELTSHPRGRTFILARCTYIALLRSYIAASAPLRIFVLDIPNSLVHIEQKQAPMVPAFVCSALRRKLLALRLRRVGLQKRDQRVDLGLFQLKIRHTSVGPDRRRIFEPAL